MVNGPKTDKCTRKSAEFGRDPDSQQDDSSLLSQGGSGSANQINRPASRTATLRNGAARSSLPKISTSGTSRNAARRFASVRGKRETRLKCRGSPPIGNDAARLPRWSAGTVLILVRP